MLVARANIDPIFWGWETRFKTSYEATETFYKEVATEIPSNARETHYVWSADLPMMREWVGERVLHNLQARAYTLVNRKFEDSYKVPVDDIEDQQLEVWNLRADGLGQAVKLWPDQVLAAAIEAGTTAVGFDGQPFFHNSHPQNVDDPGSPTYSNNFDNTATGGSSSMPLNAGNLQIVWGAMASYKNDQGRPLGIDAKVLMVPPALRAPALAIANADFIAPAAAFAGNAANLMQSNVLKGTLRIVVNRWLTSSTTWYLLDVDRPIKPFIWQLRKAAEYQFLNRPTDPNVFYDDAFVFGCKARGAAGYSLPFLVARANT